MKTKICSQCEGDPKPLTEFHTRSNGKPYSYCKLCQREYTKEHYEKNKSKYVEKAKRNTQRYIESIREWLLAYFKIHPCVDCGEIDPLVLEFDHRDGEEKEGEIGKLIRKGNLKRIQAEVKKCDVRCANCHKRRTAKQFGTWRWAVSSMQRAHGFEP